MNLMKNAATKAVASLVLVAFASANLFFAHPQTANAQATAAASCVTAYAAALVGATPSIVNDVIAVPSSEKDTPTDVITTGSTNAISFNNCILKPLGQTIVITLIRNIGSSIVEWVNSGFEGKPLFVTDFEGTLLDAADQAVGQFIEGSELGWLCNDFSFQIRIALAAKYSRPFRENVRCTLSDIGDNVSDFVDNNGGRGWDNWLKLTTRPSNNIYGAYLIADSEAAQRVLNAARIKEKRITLAEGFLDFETCDAWETPTEAAQRASGPSAPANGTTGGSAFENFDTGLQTIQFGDGPAITVNKPAPGPSTFSGSIEQVTPKCKKSSTKTPGKIISGKLSSVLGQGEIQAAVADEIDEVIAATLNQLAQKMIQGATGLLGLSQKSSTRPPSYLDRYRSQFYGTGSTAGSAVTTGASSELDSYRIGSFDEAQALIGNTGDSSIGAIDDFVGRAVDQAAGQQQEQLGAVLDNSLLEGATTNSALLKSTNQSSGGNSKGAVDGITTTSQYTKGIATAGDEADPWWSVDIGDTRKIKEVRVWKVTDKPADQTIETFRVVVSGGAGGSWTSAAIDGTAVDNPIVVPVGKEGDTVRIEKIAAPYECDYYRYSFGETCYYPLELAEVEVVTEVTGTQTGPVTSPSSGQSGSSSSAQTGSQSSSSGGGTGSIILTQATASALEMSPSSEAFVPSTAGIKGEYSFSFNGGPYTIPSLDIALLKAGQAVAMDSVFSDAQVSLVQGDRQVNFRPGSASGITLQNVNVPKGSDTKVVVSGTPLASMKGAYRITVSAKDASGFILGTTDIDFVVQ